jgi:N-acetylmuramoyl-L-alanine amidase
MQAKIFHPAVLKGGLTRLLPWLGLGLLTISLIGLFFNQQIRSLVRFSPHDQQETISGSFDTVVIDPGHGGQDSGASSHNLTEKVLTLDLGVRLARELQKFGLKTLLTRDTDSYVSLADRVIFASTVHNAVFVSLHCNFTSDPSAKGLEIYRSSEKSGLKKILVKSGAGEEPLNLAEERLAQCIGDSMVQTIHAEIRGAKTANFFVIRNLNYPAVLVESGFLTNGGEARRLANAAYRQQLAESLAAGIETYYSTVSNQGEKLIDPLRPARPISVITGVSQ